MKLCIQAMAPSRSTATDTSWDHEYHTLRREHLFRNPPTDHTAFPALQLAIDPHNESFNALFPADGSLGLVGHGLADIGPKSVLDGTDASPPDERNRLTIRYKSVALQRSLLPPTNKFATNREILPAECRERHVTYRGKLSVVFEYQINDGEPQEFVREMGQVPLMVKVSAAHHAMSITPSHRLSQTNATWRATPRPCSSRERRRPRSWVATSSSTASRRSSAC